MSKRKLDSISENKISLSSIPKTINNNNNNTNNNTSEKRRLVFRHTLDSPYIYQWKKLQQEDEFNLMRNLQRLLEPVRAYKTLYERINLEKAIQKKKFKKQKEKEKKGPEHKEPTKEDKMDIEKPILATSTTTSPSSSLSLPNLEKLKIKRDEILKSFIVGTNAVTTNLQNCIQKQTLTDLECIFVCKEDVEPSILYQHVPIMAHLASHGALRVCALSRSMESTLSKAFGLKRIAVFGIVKNISSECEPILSIIQKNIPSIQLAWFSFSDNNKKRSKEEEAEQQKSTDNNKSNDLKRDEESINVHYQPLNVKTLKTFASIQMKKNSWKSNKNNNNKKLKKS